MVPVDSLERFLAAPAGRYVLCQRQLFWCFSPTLCGSAHWGRAGATELAEVVAFVSLVRSPAMRRPFDLVSDASAVSLPEIEVYNDALAAVGSLLDAMRAGVRRHALVRGDAMQGALVEGFMPLLGSDHEWRVFSDAPSAFAWIGGAEAAAAEVARLIAGAAGTPPVLRALRAALDGRRGDLELAAAASALGVSRRSLQRTLGALGTSFRREREAAQVRAACQLLESSDDKIESVALAVGCASLTVFDRLFRRASGCKPSEYRARHRP